jgi:hypothetical protein
VRELAESDVFARALVAVSTFRHLLDRPLRGELRESSPVAANAMLVRVPYERCVSGSTVSSAMLSELDWHVSPLYKLLAAVDVEGRALEFTNPSG